MYRTINPIDIAGDNKFSFEYPTPKQCPVCHTAIDAKILNSHFMMKDSRALVFITFFCHSCEMCFLGAYICFDPQFRYRNKLSEKMLIPNGFVPIDFSENIRTMSPSFISIYNQAAEAEAEGLKDICGMGYRKSLEFLIKDFIVFIHPEKRDEVEKKSLSKCISDHIESSRIRTLAKASAWIGNDETHYTRKHPDYDIDSLKAFIASTVSFIDSEMNYYKAQALLEKNKSQ